MVEQSKIDKMKREKSPVQLIAEKEILRRLKKLVPKTAMEVSLVNDKRVTVYVNKKHVPKIIGKGGKRIAELEKKIGLSINVDELDNAPSSFQKRLESKAQVTDMSSMFDGCESLKSLKGLENWNTQQVTNMYGMFESCESLTNLKELKK